MRRIACYASTLPTKSRAILVGLGRLELPTSPLSGVRSNQLSYRPENCAGKQHICGRHSASPYSLHCFGSGVCSKPAELQACMTFYHGFLSIRQFVVSTY